MHISFFLFNFFAKSRYFGISFFLLVEIISACIWLAGLAAGEIMTAWDLWWEFAVENCVDIDEDEDMMVMKGLAF